MFFGVEMDATQVLNMTPGQLKTALTLRDMAHKVARQNGGSAYLSAVIPEPAVRHPLSLDGLLRKFKEVALDQVDIPGDLKDQILRKRSGKILALPILLRIRINYQRLIFHQCLNMHQNQ